MKGLSLGKAPDYDVHFMWSLKVCLPDFQKILRFVGLEVNIEVDFIALRCCSVDWIEVSEDNAHWWVVVNIKFPKFVIMWFYLNVVIREDGDRVEHIET